MAKMLENVGGFKNAPVDAAFVGMVLVVVYWGKLDRAFDLDFGGGGGRKRRCGWIPGVVILG